MRQTKYKGKAKSRASAGSPDSKSVSLQQATAIGLLGVAVLMFFALFTYHPSDPGPFVQDFRATEQCQNEVGCKGAWVANLLLGMFGYMAYMLPVLLVSLAFSKLATPRSLITGDYGITNLNRVITAVAVVVCIACGSGLCAMFFDSGLPGSIGGGFIGRFMYELLAGAVAGYVGALIIMGIGFIGSLTVVTNFDWAWFIDVVGDLTLRFANWLQNIFKAEKDNFNVHQSKRILAKGKASAHKISNLLERASLLVGQQIQGQPQPLAEPGYAADPLADPMFPSDDLDDSPMQFEAPAAGNVEGSLGTPSVLPEKKPASSSGVELQPPPLLTNMPKKHQQLELSKATLAPKKGAKGLPKLSLLNPATTVRIKPSKTALESLSQALIESLGHYGIDGAEVVNKAPGPVITRFELQLPDGTKASKISGLANDLARNLCVSRVRVVEVIPGRPTIGIEIPNERRDIVSIREILESATYKHSRSDLTLALGKDIGGKSIVADLQKMPHLLVAGTTGSGKSVAVNAMLLSLLYKATPEDVRLILIDPKMLELNTYEHIPHLLTPVVTDMKDAANALRWCVAEMERRYLLMSKLKVRHIDGYNEKIREARATGKPILDPLHDPSTSLEAQPAELDTLPYIVIVIDEFADMMMIVGKKVEELIARLAQKARAAGIHLILATQRPSVDVITGLIKANIPARIAFQVSTRIDSRTIIDTGGAEQLLGHGDMLFMPPGTSLPQRIHGALVTDQEVELVAQYLREQGEPEYVDAVLMDAGGQQNGIPGLESLESSEDADPLYDQAVEIVSESRRASISYLQRRLKVGYNRAARMIEDMELAGVVSPVQANGMREVIAPPPVQLD